MASRSTRATAFRSAAASQVSDVRTCRPDELGLFLRTCTAAFGGAIDDDEVARLSPVFDTERLFLACEDDNVVGTAGTLAFRLSVPGGEVDCGGVTMVGVLPGHRRRGHLQRLMERVLEDGHERGEALSVLWSTGGDLYGRFGYGLGAFVARIDAARERVELASEPTAGAQVRLVELDEAMDALPAIYEDVRSTTLRAGVSLRGLVALVAARRPTGDVAGRPAHVPCPARGRRTARGVCALPRPRLLGGRRVDRAPGRARGDGDHAPWA